MYIFIEEKFSFNVLIGIFSDEKLSKNWYFFAIKSFLIYLLSLLRMIDA